MRRVAGKVDQDINPVVANALRQGLVGDAGGDKPMVKVVAEFSRDRRDFDGSAVRSHNRLQSCEVVLEVLEDRGGELRVEG